MTDLPPSLPFVGRASERAELAAAMGRAEGGAAELVLLVGEPGVGKSRLAQAAAAEAERRGWTVAAGRAYEVEAGVPYAVFADALAPTLRRLDPAALAVLTRGAAGELAGVFPALFASGRAETAGGAGGGPEGKARLYWSVAQLLARLAARRPLLLVLDNLQWADAASLELLHFVARQLRAPHDPARVLLLGAYPEAGRDASAPLAAAERSLVSLGAARLLPVPPLSRPETAELVRRAFGADGGATAGFAELLYESTRGNPFFVEEALKSLADAGRLVRQDGRWHGWEAVSALALPRSVRDAVLGRVARLGAAARRALDLAAVLGARVTYDALRAVSGLGDAELLAALDELQRARLLVEGAAAPPHDGYDFAHPLVRETVYAQLGRARARVLHGAAATALEALYGARALEHADELAIHFTRHAPAGGVAPRAVRYLVGAGVRALAAHADHAAASYLQAAVDQLDASGAAAGGAETTGDAVEAIEALARARQRLGELDAALQLWRRARGAAEARGDLSGVAAAERRMGVMAYASGRHADALTHYAAGLEAAAAANDRPLATRLQLAAGNSLQALGRRADAQRAVRAALGTAEALGDPALLARVHRALLLLHAWTGPVDEARAHGEQAIALAARAGEPTVGWSAHWAMAILGGLTGDAESTAHHLGRSEQLADEIRSPVRRLWTAEVAVEYMAGVGEWHAALALAARTIPAARALGQRTLLPRLLVWTGLIHRGRGDLARSRECVEEAWALSGAGGVRAGPVDVHAAVPAHTGMAGYCLAAGEYERALAVGEAGLTIADRTGYVAWAVYRLLPFAIESALYLRDYERAARHSERLRRDSRALSHALGLAWADTTDALLAYFTRPAHEAAPLLLDAARALDAVPFVFDAARLRRTAARALLGAGSREGALRELRQAHSVFARLGAERELRGTRDQLRELGARPPARGVASAGAGAGAAASAHLALSGREAEIAGLVARRKSNKEIAAALSISPRTVSTHLSNIFGRLGVSSRGELADLVRGAPPE